jgi:hypothetical protein
MNCWIRTRACGEVSESPELVTLLSLRFGARGVRNARTPVPVAVDGAREEVKFDGLMIMASRPRSMIVG